MGMDLLLENEKIGKMRYWWLEIPELVFDEYCPKTPVTTMGYRRNSSLSKSSSSEKTSA
jgi:hypothetical protein